MQYKIPLVLSPQPEGGYTVTSPLLPELVTEGDTAEEALENVRRRGGSGRRNVPRSRPIFAERHASCGPERSTGVRNSGQSHHEISRSRAKLTTFGCQELPRRGGGSHRKWYNPATQNATVVPIGVAVI